MLVMPDCAVAVFARTSILGAMVRFFDILDGTKIILEDLIPVQRVGKMVLNRNPESYFTETEQVAFMTSNVVPGIDFSNDPFLQGRNFSHNDTQLIRLGSPNFHELPINRPVCPFSNNQRDAHMLITINKGRRPRKERPISPMSWNF